MPPRINLSGKRFGRLTALKDSGKRNHAGDIIWECACDCGQKTFVKSNNLQADHTRSCGCLHKELMIGNNYRNNYGLKHGDDRRGSRSRLYSVWGDMKARCSNPNVTGFEYWGGKGITVCPEWKNNYLPFKVWALSHDYQPGSVIDRINSDGNYTPENCQFISKSENRRKAHETKNNAHG